jgi:hypothetical protein
LEARVSASEAPPEGVQEAGARLWASVLADYELEEHERALLVEAVRTLDLLTDLEALVRVEGPVIDSPQGRKAHPAAVEARQQRIALARLLAALRLPTGDESDEARPQRRVGVRGHYGIRSAG